MEKDVKVQVMVKIPKDLNDALMFKLYKLHEETGHKITKTALIIALIDTYVHSDIPTEIEDEDDDRDVILPGRLQELMKHFSEVNAELKSNPGESFNPGERMVTLHECGPHYCCEGIQKIAAPPLPEGF